MHLHLFTSQKPFSGPGLQPGFGSLLPQRCVAKKWRGVGVLRVSRMNTGRMRFSECHSGEAVVSGVHRLLGEVRRGNASRCLASGLWVAASRFSSPSRQVPRGPWGLQMPPQSPATAKVKGKGRSWRKRSAHGPPAGPPLPCREMLDRAHPRTQGVVTTFEHASPRRPAHSRPACSFVPRVTQQQQSRSEGGSPGWLPLLQSSAASFCWGPQCTWRTSILYQG